MILFGCYFFAHHMIEETQSTKNKQYAPLYVYYINLLTFKFI